MAKYLIGDRVSSGVSTRLKMVSCKEVVRSLLNGRWEIPLMFSVPSTTSQTFTKGMSEEFVEEFVADTTYVGIPDKFIKALFCYNGLDPYWAVGSEFKKSIHLKYGQDISELPLGGIFEFKRAMAEEFDKMF